MGNEKAVLCITINKPVVGREQDAINLWLDTPGWLDEQQHEWRRSEDFEAWSRTQLCMEDLTIAPGVTTDAMRPR